MEEKPVRSAAVPLVGKIQFGDDVVPTQTQKAGSHNTQPHRTCPTHSQTTPPPSFQPTQAPGGSRGETRVEGAPGTGWGTEKEDRDAWPFRLRIQSSHTVSLIRTDEDPTPRAAGGPVQGQDSLSSCACDGGQRPVGRGACSSHVSVTWMTVAGRRPFRQDSGVTVQAVGSGLRPQCSHTLPTSGQVCRARLSHWKIKRCEDWFRQA